MSDVRMFIENRENNQSDYFSLPVSEEVLAEKIGLNSSRDGYSVSVEEISFLVEDIGVEGIIAASKQLEELLQKFPIEDIWLLKTTWFNDYAELYYNSFEIDCYFGEDSFESFGHYLIDDVEREGEISELLKRCIDYEKYAMYVQLSSECVVGKNGIYRYTG